MVGLSFTAIALLEGLGDTFPYRPSQAPIGVLPGPAIVFSGCADDALRVLVYFRAIVLLQGVLLLGLDITAANLNGIEFVSANAPEKNFLAAGLGIKKPLP